jgi:hypothetical protein
MIKIVEGQLSDVFQVREHRNSLAVRDWGLCTQRNKTQEHPRHLSFSVHYQVKDSGVQTLDIVCKVRLYPVIHAYVRKCWCRMRTNTRHGPPGSAGLSRTRTMHPQFLGLRSICVARCEILEQQSAQACVNILYIHRELSAEDAKEAENKLVNTTELHSRMQVRRRS